MGAINTAAYLAKIRGRMDAQQQVISLLESELQAAILGGGNKSAKVLFSVGQSATTSIAAAPSSLATVNLTVGAVGSETLKFTKASTGNPAKMELRLAANGNQNADLSTAGVLREVGLVDANVPGAVLINGTGATSPQTGPGNTASVPAMYYLPKNENGVITTGGTTAAPTYTFSDTANLTDDVSTYNALAKGSISEIYVNDGLEEFGKFVVDAMRAGASTGGEAFDVNSDAPVDQDLLRQMLAQARSLLGELRIEEQAWNGEVNSEKTLRKEVNDFAKV
jgi:hypothetical protein